MCIICEQKLKDINWERIIRNYLINTLIFDAALIWLFLSEEKVKKDNQLKKRKNQTRTSIIVFWQNEWK